MNLDLHHDETLSQSRPAMSVDQLERFNHATPHLDQLSIDIDRNGTWPWESFTEIARIGSLRRVDFWLDLASDCQRQMPEPYTRRALESYGNSSEDCIGDNQYRQPLLNESSAMEVFRYIRSRKKGNELTSVTFCVGDWTRPWDGPLYFGDWLEGKRGKFSCGTGSDFEVLKHEQVATEGDIWCKGGFEVD